MQIKYYRLIHRSSGAYLSFFFVILFLTGILLGWKKNSHGYLQPITQTGTETNLANWICLDSLQKIALKTYRKDFGSTSIPEVDRIDVRSEKGVVKFSFKNSNYEIQIDGGDGSVLSKSNRYSDFIESIHDGSILDDIFKTRGGVFKLIYTTLTGLSLLLFTVTGFIIWFHKKRAKKLKYNGKLNR